jgi:hypothetical protein
MLDKKKITAQIEEKKIMIMIKKGNNEFTLTNFRNSKIINKEF